MKICIYSLLFFIIFTPHIFAQKKFSVEAKFTIAVNDEITYPDQYELKGKLDLGFTITEKFKCELGLEADKFEVDVEEVLFKYLKTDYEIMFGKYKNKLAKSDIVSSRSDPLFTKSAVEKLLIDQSYINRSIGAGVESSKKRENDYFFFKISSLEAQFFEPQFNLVYMYMLPNEFWIGLAGCYFPFFIKDEYLGNNAISSENLEGDVENNFSASLILYKHKGTFIFGSETAFGKNIHDPIGLLYSGLYSSRNYFLGTDLYAGIRLYMQQTEIIPVLRATALFPDTDNMKCNLIELSLNSKIGFTKDIRIDLTGGARIVTQYDYDKNLETSLDPMWTVGFRCWF